MDTKNEDRSCHFYLSFIHYHLLLKLSRGASQKDPIYAKYIHRIVFTDLSQFSTMWTELTEWL